MAPTQETSCVADGEPVTSPPAVSTDHNPSEAPSTDLVTKTPAVKTKAKAKAKTKPSTGKKRDAPSANSEPAAKKAKLQTGEEIQSLAADKDGHNSEESQTIGKKSKVKGKATKAATAARRAKKAQKVERLPIPMKYDEASPADKVLVDNRATGMDWASVTSRWLELAGRSHDEQLSKSTLPNRLMRMKEKFSMIDDKDHVLLFAAKKQVESDLEAEKWDRIVTEIASKGGGEYKAENLRRCYKRLMEKGGDLSIVASPRDNDFPGDD